MDERRTDSPYNPQASPQYARPAPGYPSPTQRPFVQPQLFGSSPMKDAQVLTQGGFKPLSSFNLGPFQQGGDDYAAA